MARSEGTSFDPVKRREAVEKYARSIEATLKWVHPDVALLIAQRVQRTQTRRVREKIMQRVSRQ